MRRELIPNEEYVNVWDTCGEIGLFLPWAEWKMYGLLPTCYAKRGIDKIFVCLVTEENLKGWRARKEQPPEAVYPFPHVIIDPYILEERRLTDSNKLVGVHADWSAIRQKIIDVSFEFLCVQTAVRRGEDWTLGDVLIDDVGERWRLITRESGLKAKRDGYVFQSGKDEDLIVYSYGGEEFYFWEGNGEDRKRIDRKIVSRLEPTTL